MNREIYQEPLVSRYTSRAMQELFSEQNRIQTWRRCWIALAEAQNELGLADIVTREMIDELKEHGCSFVLSEFDNDPQTLRLLDHLPVEMVKLRPGLAKGLSSSTENQEIIRAVTT